MNKVAALGLTVLAVAFSATAGATPEEDIDSLLRQYKESVPSIPVADYIYGALAMSPDAKKQYDDIMSFPPFQSDLDRGKEIWERPFRNGKRFADCYPNGGHNIAGNYPYFDEALGKVVTFEMSLNHCLKDNGEAEMRYDDMKTMGALTAYARSLSDGMTVNVRVNGPGALAAYEAGKRIFYERRGQLGFSCAICHVDKAGLRVRNEFLSTAIGQATHWPVFRSPGDDLWTLQRRYEGCYKLIRAQPPALGSEDFNNLEYFHTYLSRGLPMKAAVFRK